MAVFLLSGLASGAESRADRETLQQGLFVIEYAPTQQKTAALTLKVLEEALEEFSAVLPAGSEKVRVLVMDTLDEFDNYAVSFTGLDVAGIARPDNNLIVVKAPRLRLPRSDYAGTLRHELVHLLLYRNIGYDWLPQWLNEGIAMSLANEHHWEGMYRIALMFVRNRIIPYHQIDNAFYRPVGREQFDDAYVQALYMTRYLRNRLGEPRFWELVYAMKDRSFAQALEKVTAISLQEFCRDYERNLWKYAIIALTASGFAFQPGAILLILAYLRRRRIARKIYQRWEEEEALEAADGPEPVYWDEVVEDPDAWKRRLEDDQW